MTYEPMPNAGLEADGIEADTLLFTGRKMAEADGDVLPPQIILFLENLWEFADRNKDIFRNEVQTTFCTSWDII